jgi:hypothetical protein
MRSWRLIDFIFHSTTMRSQCARVAGSQPPRQLIPSRVLTASPPGSREHIICPDPERMSWTHRPTPQTISPCSSLTAVPKRSAAQYTFPLRSLEQGPWPQIVSPKVSRMHLALANEHINRASAATKIFRFIIQPSQFSSHSLEQVTIHGVESSSSHHHRRGAGCLIVGLRQPVGRL